MTLIGVWQRDKDSDFYDLPFDRRIFMGMASLNSTFILPVKPDLRLTLNGFCQTGAIQGIYDLPTSGNLDLGLRYAFAGGNCILTAWCKDIFQTAGIDPQIRYGRQWVTNDYSCFRSVGRKGRRWIRRVSNRIPAFSVEISRPVSGDITACERGYLRPCPGISPGPGRRA